MAMRNKSSAVLVASDLGFYAHVFDEHDVAHLLRAAVEREGGQSAFATHHGVNRAYLNMILNGRRPVSDSIARALGLHKVYIAQSR
jgi:DNA-binding phage protein